ncbi:MAG: hypothetical protein R3F49_16830 [Planctomycetota bacterium]
MALAPLPTLAYHPLRLVFLAAFWWSSALAFLTRLERFSTLFACVTALLLGLGLGVVVVLAAAPTAAARSRPR